MKRAILIGLVFLFSIFQVFSIGFQDITINSTDNTTSLVFDKLITMDSLTIGTDYVYLDNFYLTGCDKLLYSGYFSKNYTNGTYITSTFNTLYCPSSLTQEQSTSAFTGYIVVFVFFSICITFIVAVVTLVITGLSKTNVIDKQILFMLLLFMFISVVTLLVAMMKMLLDLALRT